MSDNGSEKKSGMWLISVIVAIGFIGLTTVAYIVMQSNEAVKGAETVAAAHIAANAKKAGAAAAKKDAAPAAKKEEKKAEEPKKEEKKAE